MYDTLICRSAPDSSVDAKIWMMKCSEVTDDSDCFTTLYDEKMDLSSLANFMRRLDLPAQVQVHIDHKFGLVFFLSSVDDGANEVFCSFVAMVFIIFRKKGFQVLCK